MTRRNHALPVLLTLGGVVNVTTPDGVTRCTVQQVNRSNAVIAGSGVRIKVRKNGEEEYTVELEVEDAEGRKLLYD